MSARASRIGSPRLSTSEWEKVEVLNTVSKDMNSTVCYLT